MYILFPSLQVANSHNWQGGQIHIALTVSFYTALQEFEYISKSPIEICERSQREEDRKHDCVKIGRLSIMLVGWVNAQEQYHEIVIQAWFLLQWVEFCPSLTYVVDVEV